MKQQLLLTLKRISSRLPTKLPVGRTEFESWANDIFELSGNYADKDSMEAALCQMLIHLAPAKNSRYQTPAAFVPKHHFVCALRKGAANQVASVIYMEIVERSKQKAAEETAAKQKEQATVSDGKETDPGLQKT